MCRDLKPIKKKQAIVYKVVARKLKGKRYYSIAMGCIYPQKGKVPIVKIQHKLGYFLNDLLTNRSIFTSHMTGRTAGFTLLEDAKILANNIRNSANWASNHKILIVKAKLTEALMFGTYDVSPVIAGRHIEFLE